VAGLSFLNLVVCQFVIAGYVIQTRAARLGGAKGFNAVWMTVKMMCAIRYAMPTFVMLLLAGCAGLHDRRELVERPAVMSTPSRDAVPPQTLVPTKTLLYTFSDEQGTTPIWSIAGRDGFFFSSGMAINADGAPNAYHPNKSSGLDFLANAGHTGNWWGLATDNGKPSGEPLVQEVGEFKGFYVSQTSLCDGSKLDADITKYVDARNVPFLVLPPQLLGPGLARMGDLAVVYNMRNGNLEYVIVADQGPRDTIGEGSIALAASLGIGTDLRNHTAGQETGVVYLVLPQTAADPAWPRSVDDIRNRAATAFEAWGGIDLLKSAISR
jgi:hypothetical protein